MSPSSESESIGDTVINRVNHLKHLVEQGVLKKSDLAPMIKAIYLGCSNTTSPSSPPERKHHSITKVLQNGSRSFRRAASPETARIRRIIEVPVTRRFEMQCATLNSPLFGATPPRRLNEELFNHACEDPLETVYTNNAKELAKVPASKVISIVKWKVRKMRGNLIKRGVAKEDGVFFDDGFDWDAATTNLSPKKICVRPVAKRQYVRLYQQKDPVQQQQKPIAISDDDSSDTPTEDEPFTPNANKSAFKPATPPPLDTPSKRKCTKCGILSVPYPRDMDWTSNTSACSYCKDCFSELNDQCEQLAAPTSKPKEKEIQKKRRRRPSTTSTSRKRPRNQVWCLLILCSVFCFHTSVHVFCICHRTTRLTTTTTRTSLPKRKTRYYVCCYFLFFHIGVYQHLHYVFLKLSSCMYVSQLLLCLITVTG